MNVAAIYPGSFDPFHVGHLSVAEKAGRIFRDVYIVRAHNSSKKPRDPYFNYPTETLTRKGFRLVDLEDGDLTTNFITRIEENKGGVYSAYSNYDSVVLIRGLRNEHDFVYEENLSAAYSRLKPDLKIVHIFANQEYNYVSSSLLREYGHLPQFKNLVVK